jgi:hypothetical protein
VIDANGGLVFDLELEGGLVSTAVERVDDDTFVVGTTNGMLLVYTGNKITLRMQITEEEPTSVTTIVRFI